MCCGLYNYLYPTKTINYSLHFVPDLSLVVGFVMAWVVTRLPIHTQIRSRCLVVSIPPAGRNKRRQTDHCKLYPVTQCVLLYSCTSPIREYSKSYRSHKDQRILMQVHLVRNSPTNQRSLSVNYIKNTRSPKDRYDHHNLSFVTSDCGRRRIKLHMT